MDSFMMDAINKRIDEIMSNETSRCVIVKMQKEGKTESEIKDFVYHLAVGTLLFGSKKVD